MCGSPALLTSVPPAMKRLIRFVTASATLSLVSLVLVSCSEPSAIAPVTVVTPKVRIVTFGDSHVDFGIMGDRSVDVSYISQDLIRSGIKSVHSPYSLAGKIEALSTSKLKIETVNHGIGGTSSDDSWRFDGEPNALAVWKGVTRFEAEVLGRGGPDWDAGTGKLRLHAFKPTPDDYVYASFGTMDVVIHVDSGATRRNIKRMIALWKEAGLPASHFMLATLTPNDQIKPNFPGQLVALNGIFAEIAAEEGITLIDVSAKTRNGEDWIPGTTGEGLHANEVVMASVAQDIVNKIVELRK